MAKLRYLIRRLSVKAMLSYAKPTDQGTYSFALTPAQTKSIIMGDGDTWQEDNAIFFQAMCILRGEKYRQPTSDTLTSKEDLIGMRITRKRHSCKKRPKPCFPRMESH